MGRFVANGDRENFASYLLTRKCMLTTKGQRVTLTDPGVLTVEFVYQGQKYWAAAQAVNR